MDVSKKIAKAVTEEIAKALQDAFSGSDAFWQLVDAEVLSQIKATEHGEAQLWLSDEGPHQVCIDIHKCDEPLVVPFFVPDIPLPSRAEYTGQVEETLREIRARRLLAKELNDMADAAEASLAAMGINPPPGA